MEEKTEQKHTKTGELPPTEKEILERLEKLKNLPGYDSLAVKVDDLLKRAKQGKLKTLFY